MPEKDISSIAWYLYFFKHCGALALLLLLDAILLNYYYYYYYSC